MIKKLQLNWTQWFQGLLFVAASIIVFIAIVNMDVIMAAIGRFLSVVSPVIMAMVIAYMLSRPCKWVEKWIRNIKEPFIAKRARGLSVLSVFLLLFGLIYLVASFLFPLVVGNIIEFINYVPQLYTEVEEFVMGIEWAELDEMFGIQAMINEFFDNFSMRDVVNYLNQAFGFITDFALTTTLWLFDFLVALIISVYMLLYKDVIFETIGRVAKIGMKEKNMDTLKYYMQQADNLFYKFIGAQFLDACIMGAMAIVLLLFLDVQFAVFLGVFVGVCNMIPKFGSIFASVVVIALTFVTGGVTQGIWTAVLLTIIQQIDGNIIGPKIMGEALKINPILVFFAILVGGAYFGVLGMFLSIPVMALIKIIFMNIVAAKEGIKDVEAIFIEGSESG